MLSQRGAVFGLTLILPLFSGADTALPESNFLLIHDAQHPENTRLLIFNDETATMVDESPARPNVSSEVEVALAMTLDADLHQRVRGLTLLSGDDSVAALNAGMELLYDSSARAREEAVQLVMNHPQADIELVAAIGSGDPSTAIRQATADLSAELAGD